MKQINLLPKEKQQTLVYENLFRGILRFIELALLTFALVFVGQFATWSYLRTYESNINAKTEAIKAVSNKADNAKLKSQIKEINGQINDFKSLLDTTPAWSKAIVPVNSHVPSDMRITTVTADAVKKKLEIRGYSPTREGVIAFYNSIKEDTDAFAGINYPLENVTRPTEVYFNFTVELKDEILKK